MYTQIANAIKSKQEIILSLVDGSKISGFPSWGEDRSRVRIKSQDKVVWVPLEEIMHVTTLLRMLKGDQQDLQQFEDRYNFIMLTSDDPHQRAVKLGEVMTQMEGYFRIPLVGKERIEKFKHEYPYVWQLYVKISSSRR